MIVIKKLSSFNTRYFYNKREELNTNLWAEQSYSVSIWKTSKMYNNLFYDKGTICHDFIAFDRNDHTLTIEVCIPKDLIQYTRCHYFRPKISIEELKGSRNEVTYQGMIKFSYNGPEELSLLWRLSI